MTAARLVHLACVVAILTGCAVGPDYVAPKTQLAPLHNWDAVKARAGVPLAPALDRWWLGFNDPTLVTIIQRGLDQNLDLAAAMARVTQARAAARGSRAQLLPTVDANATGLSERQSVQSPLGRVEEEIPGFSRYEKEFTLGGTASWELDVFGGLRRAARAAEDELQAAYADHAGTRISVVADAADAYFQVRGFQARIAVAQEQVDTDQKLLNLVEVRRRLGDADSREAAQADALLKQARASLPDLQINLQAQLNRLDVLMGAQPGTYAHELEERREIPAIPAISVEDPPVEMLRRRPDVIAAERRLAESNERIGVAIADYYPKVSLSGVLGFDSDSVHSLFSNRAFQPIGSGAISWRLFDFGKVTSEVAQARGAKSEAIANYRQSVLKAAEDVENALITLSATEVHVVEIQGEVDALAKARDLSEKSYKAGAITLTDVLDANRQLLTAREDFYVNRANAARAAVQTFRAFGGGWGSVTDASTAAN